MRNRFTAAPFIILVAALVLGCARTSAVLRPAPSTVERPDPGKEVRGNIQFSIFAPGAEHVTLVLLNNRSISPATHEISVEKGENGTWMTHVDLIPGEYRYFFIVDGSVQVETRQGRVENDDFGGVTGVLNVHLTPNGQLMTF